MQRENVKVSKLLFCTYNLNYDVKHVEIYTTFYFIQRNIVRSSSNSFKCDIFIMIIKIFVLFCYLQFHISESVDRPRGVPLSMVSLYPVDGTFTCLDGSLTIPFDRVNDDYCDCETDGSDEPGTSACPNGSFYCNNVGHKPFFIPSSRINDGLCDCCDGSDEFDASLVTCDNNCYELGQAAREEEARKMAIFKEGSKLRMELSLKGKQLKREKQARLLELKKEQSEAETLKTEKENIKTKIEEQEKAALDVYKQLEDKKREQQEQEERLKQEEELSQLYKEIDMNNDGLIDKEEISKHSLFDTDKNGVVNEEELKILFGDEEKLSLEKFLANGLEYVKQLLAMQKVKETADESASEEKPSREPHDAESEADEELLGERRDEDEDDKDDAEQLPEEAESPEVEHEETIKPEYDEETKKIIEDANHIRSEYDDAVRNLRDVEREIRQTEEALGKDYGKDDEFAYLVGECFEFTDREYIYKMCPFDQVSQRSKNGGIETRLGSWGHWVDEKYEFMFFGNGQSCWNGPQRQTHVRLNCDLKTELVAASEPSRCEYLMEFNTPAVCVWKESQEPSEDSHDEL